MVIDLDDFDGVTPGIGTTPKPPIQNYQQSGTTGPTGYPPRLSSTEEEQDYHWSKTRFHMGQYYQMTVDKNMEEMSKGGIPRKRGPSTN